jgi:uncharacterized protein (DUF885 family)
MTEPAATRPIDALAATYWEAFLETNPLFATTLGDGRFDGRLPEPTPEGQAADRARYAAILAQADALDALDALDAGGAGQGERGSGDPITLSSLREGLQADLAFIDSGLLAWNVDPLDGIPVHLLQAGEYQPAATPVQATAMLERWRAMPAYTDAHTATLRRSLADGLVACRAPVDRVVGILAELLASPDEDWPLLAPLAGSWTAGAGTGAAGAGSAGAGTAGTRPPDGWTGTERERFASGLRAALAEGIRPAFARLHDALVTDVRPAARPPDKPGLCHLPGGDATYRTLARAHTSLDAAPDELHRTGLAEIDRIDAELADLAGRMLGTRTLSDALASLRGDPALHFGTRDEVHAKAVSALARATEAIPGWFGRLPQAPCEVVRMGPHEEEHSTIAYYRQPADDGSRPGQYYLNTAHPETRPRYEAEVLAYHESIPGHHLQIAIAQELADLPAFRRHLGPTAFFEGWGLYTERLADEMGLYTGDLDRIGVLSFDAWRASRLVVDTGLHAMGWTRQQAIDFMLEHTALAPNNIANEVDRYIVIPGQALAYKTGQLELLRLRAVARERLGPAFDIRAFHDTVLGNGAVALPTLRGIVEAWTTRSAAVASPTRA